MPLAWIPELRDRTNSNISRIADRDKNHRARNGEEKKDIIPSRNDEAHEKEGSEEEVPTKKIASEKVHIKKVAGKEIATQEDDRSEKFWR